MKNKLVKAPAALAAVGALALSALGTTSAAATEATAEDFKVVELNKSADVLEVNLGDRTAFPEGVKDLDTSDENSINIVGGTRAPRGAYPWVAKLSIKVPEGTAGCGGTIVSKDIVITAQHCMDGKVDSVQVRYGHNEWRKGTLVDGARFINGSGIKRGDWSVLKLDGTARPGFMPTVATNTAYNSGPFRAMGWGAIRSKGPSSAHLLQVDLPFIDDRTCGTGSAEICAGDWYNGGIDTCQGDSGGPLVNMNGGKPVLVGITSWGRGCAAAKNPGHYTEVSTYVSSMKSAVNRMNGTMFNGGGGGGDNDDKPVKPVKPVKPGEYANTERKTIRNYGSATTSLRSSTSGAKSLTLDIDVNHACANHLKIDLTTPDGVKNTVKRSSYASGRRCFSWNGVKSETYSMRSKSNGTWSLTVADDYSGASGTLNGWKIKLS